MSALSCVSVSGREFDVRLMRPYTSTTTTTALTAMTMNLFGIFGATDPAV